MSRLKVKGVAEMHGETIPGMMSELIVNICLKS